MAYRQLVCPRFVDCGLRILPTLATYMGTSRLLTSTQHVQLLTEAKLLPHQATAHAPDITEQRRFGGASRFYFSHKLFIPEGVIVAPENHPQRNYTHKRSRDNSRCTRKLRMLVKHVTGSNRYGTVILTVSFFL